MKKKPIIAISMGDPAGIGPEIIVKSLTELEVKNICYPIVVGSVLMLRKAAELTTSDLSIERCETFDTIEFGEDGVSVLDCTSGDFKAGREAKSSGEAAARAIRKTVELAMAGSVDAMVTGPTSKHALYLAGYTYPGQTEFLADLTRASEVIMMLVSKNLRVALVTTHCSLSHVAPRITVEAIVTKLTILHEGLHDYFGVKEPRIAVCALNPHAGEGGIFGREEIEIIEPAIAEVKSQGINAVGPLPADTLFSQSRTKPYDAYLAMYHDQGLIPLKMKAMGKGVNVTLGLPIIRTSPDHGTAFDIAGKGIADEGSMIEAIKLAAHMSLRKHQNPSF